MSLLGRQRRLPDEAGGLLDPGHQGVDLGIQRGPVGVHHPHSPAGLPRLHQDHERPQGQVPLRLLGQPPHGERLPGVLLAHLRDDPEARPHRPPDHRLPGPRVHGDGAVGDLDGVEPQRLRAGQVAIEGPLPDAHLLEGPPGHAETPGRRDQAHLPLQEGGVKEGGRAEGELDHVNGVRRRRHQVGRLVDAEPLVHDHRPADGPGLPDPLLHREREDPVPGLPDRHPLPGPGLAAGARHHASPSRQFRGPQRVALALRISARSTRASIASRRGRASSGVSRAGTGRHS